MMLRLGYDIQFEIRSSVAMAFGIANLTQFTVISEELMPENARYA
jgi:hypothetical protein